MNNYLNLELNQTTINNLVDHGANLEDEYEIEFSFRGEPKNLTKIAEELSTKGFFLIKDMSTTDNIFFSKHLKLDLLNINEIDLDLQKLSEKYSLEYDGWGAMI